MTPEEARARLDALTPRQREVLVLRAQGLETEGIALTVGLCTRVVEHHMHNARLVLECNTSRACWMVGRAGL